MGRRLLHRVHVEDGGAGVMPSRGVVAGAAAPMPSWHGPRRGALDACGPWRSRPSGRGRQVVGRHGQSRAVPACQRMVRPGWPWDVPAAGTVCILSQARRHGGARDGGHRGGASPPACRAVARWSPTVCGREGVSCPRPGGPAASAGVTWGPRAGWWPHTRARARRGAARGSPDAWPRVRWPWRGSPGWAWAVRGVGSHGGGRRPIAHLTMACRCDPFP